VVPVVGSVLAFGDHGIIYLPDRVADSAALPHNRNRRRRRTAPGVVDRNAAIFRGSPTRESVESSQMLTRLYIDNFKCFVGFEYKPGRRQLILGGNGSGKSSLMDAFLLLQRFLVFGRKTEDVFLATDRTKWMDELKQTFEVEATLAGSGYLYTLVLDSHDDPVKPKVTAEKLCCDGRPIFEFERGRVSLYNDRFEQTAEYPFDASRSALATIARSDDNEKVTRFGLWMGNTLCFTINPFLMTPRAEEESPGPKPDLSNFAAWYRHLIPQHPRETQALMKSLQSSLDGFEYLRLENVGQNMRLLVAEFAKGGASINFGFNQLSEGQRNLIGLYTILHFVIAKGGTVVLDEPDNFISLGEIQPWLMAVDDAIEDHGGQVLIISHHPELINQWAPNYGVRFVRDGMGPVRVEKFHGDPDSLLAPAELIARGWEGE
jgi:predicted ATPase